MDYSFIVSASSWFSITFDSLKNYVNYIPPHLIKWLSIALHCELGKNWDFYTAKWKENAKIALKWVCVNCGNGGHVSHVQLQFMILLEGPELFYRLWQLGLPRHYLYHQICSRATRTNISVAITTHNHDVLSPDIRGGCEVYWGN